MKIFKFHGHADSFLPEGKGWKMVWNDEFDGTELDTSKWGFRRNFWGKPFPTFTDEGIELDGKSHMRMHLIEKDGEFYSPHLQTGSLTYDLPKDTDGFWPFGKYEEPKFMHKFGYYEIRCRLPKNDGWHAAFWLQAPAVGGHPNPKYGGIECDIMENYRQHKFNEIICGNLWDGYGKNGKGNGHFKYQFEETVDGWHYYAVDWSKNGYVFYADGKEVGRVDAPVSEVEQFILVSTECAGYRGDGFSAPKDHKAGTPCELLKEAVPDYFEVDHVRVFDEVSG
jgi:beta-glucanase (GH16 family)